MFKAMVRVHAVVQNRVLMGILKHPSNALILSHQHACLKHSKSRHRKES